MKIDDSPESGLPQPADRQGVPADIDQMLESIGARYIADLRSLSEAFNQLYTSQLRAKDAQLAQLGERAAAIERERDEYQAALAAKDAQLAQLGERVRQLERERDENQAVLAAKDVQIAQLGERANGAERERDEQGAALAAKDVQIAKLGEHVHQLERERDERDAYVSEFSRIGARYMADLQNLANQIGMHVNLPQLGGAFIGGPGQTSNAVESELAEVGDRANGRSGAKSARHTSGQPTLRFVGAEYHLQKIDRFVGESGQQAAVGG